MEVPTPLTIFMTSKETIHLEIQVTSKVDVLKIVKVKACTRIRNGKKEKVRTHYRRA